MAVTNTASRLDTKSYRRQALLWLLMTLILGVITALVWMFSKTPVANNKIENAPITQTATTSIGIARPTKIESLHELDADVQPVDFNAMVRDLRQYPKEFKDKRYLIRNKGKWTVQVMNVAENDVIVDYLSGREDRDKFAYFRYRDDNDQLRYMLTYGIMNSAQEANGAAQLIDFGLPANVRVLPEAFNRYVNIIDNYELAEPVVDLGANRNRQVNLQPTYQEVPVRRPIDPTSANDNLDENRPDRPDDLTSTTSNTRRSIKKSEDTSETLAVQEERVVNIDGEKIPVTEDNRPNKDIPNKSEWDNKEANKREVDNKVTDSVAPVAPTPKKDKPAKNNKVDKSNDKNNNGKSNNNAPASPKAKDSIKQLIQEKSN